mgnify:FL=1
MARIPSVLYSAESCSSETTASTLATVLFYLVKYPATLQKLQCLLDDAMPGGLKEWSYEKVKTVTFINDIINETLCLRPAVLTGGYCVTPAKGLQVDEVYIPRDVNVFVLIQLIQTNKQYCKDAHQFIPECWGERRDEMGTDSVLFLPFSLGWYPLIMYGLDFQQNLWLTTFTGLYSCPGKNLSMLSLRIAVSSITQQFNITFAPGETGEKFDKKVLDTFTTTLPPLLIQFQHQ